MAHGVIYVFHIHTMEYYAADRKTTVDLYILTYMHPSVLYTFSLIFECYFYNKKITPLKVSIFITLYYASNTFVLEIRHIKTIGLA